MGAPRIPFTKMHGIGNDYVVLDGFGPRPADPEALARALLDRRFGVGGDGLLLVLPSDQADVRMRMFNVDGSEAEMCGNGLRCLVKYAWERGRMTAKAEGTVETKAGILGWRVREADDRVESVTLDMGRPRRERREIPMSGPDGHVEDEPLEVLDRTFSVTAVSMGNPHAVTFVDDVDAFPLERYGPAVERHASFPRRTNAEFVEVVSPTELRQRTWERGCGETLACGTGACAVVVAAAATGRTKRDVVVHLRGGDLEVRWTKDDHVLLTGPAVEVFEGTWRPR